MVILTYVFIIKKTLEIKLEYSPPVGNPVKSDYNIDLYLLIPENMGINETTYEKRYFYHDVTRSIRLKSPDYVIYNYYNRLKDFDSHCTDGMQDRRCEYQFKKFITGYRSMLRNTANKITLQSKPKDIENLLKHVRRNRSIFRKLNKRYGGDQHKIFALGDEFTSIVSNVYLVRLYDRLGNYSYKEILNTIKSELKYRGGKHFPESVPGGDAVQNGILINRYDYLKGYFYDVLSLKAKRKAGDKGIKNILYASAAGISMFVATLIAFWAQKRYGNLTLPFFVALVVGYMFKDRIKDGFKSLLEKLASPVIYDYITLIYGSSGGKYPMGKTREKAGFEPPPSIIAEQLNIEINSRTQTLHFNKKVYINHKRINDTLDPEISGISDIMKLNLNRITSVLEEPLSLMYSVRDDALERTFAEKVYDIKLIINVSARGGQTESKSGILTLSASGIKNFRIV